MANLVPTSPLRPAEACVFHEPSLAVGAALALVASLDRLIEAEGDLGGYIGADPAMAVWVLDAEAALEVVLRWTEVLQRAPRRGPGDGRLRLVGQVTAGVMRCTNAAELAQRMGLVGARRSVLRMPAGAPSAAWVNGLIDGVLDRVAVCVALAEGPSWDRDFMTDPDADGCDNGWDADPDGAPEPSI